MRARDPGLSCAHNAASVERAQLPLQAHAHIPTPWTRFGSRRDRAQHVEVHDTREMNIISFTVHVYYPKSGYPVCNVIIIIIQLFLLAIIIIIGR